MVSGNVSRVQPAGLGGAIGFALWSWTDKLYDASDAGQRLDYELYAKPAEKIVQQNYAVIK